MYSFDRPIKLTNKENDVLTIGEMLVDMISKDYSEKLRSHNYERYFGGSPANIAMNLNRLGGSSQVASSVGKDSLGDFLVSYLERNGINSDLINRVELPTSMVVVNKSKGTPNPIFYRGADHQLIFSDQLIKVIKNSKIMHFSNWPISKPQSRDIVERSIILAKESNTLVCFDPNYHADLWDEENGVSYIENLLQYVDITKPSNDDAERLFGPDTPENQIEKFHQLGCPFVIMTLGEDGAIVSIEGKKRYYQSLAKEVIDTTGAGDAFWSGFYIGITQGATIEKALNLGFKVSAYNLKYIGAVVDLPHYKEICSDEGMYDDIKK